MLRKSFIVINGQKVYPDIGMVCDKYKVKNYFKA